MSKLSRKAPKLTQCERVLMYLRRHKKSTNMQLVTALWIACPWKRIDEITDPHGYVFARLDWYPAQDFSLTGERIERKFIKLPSGARVVQYHLTRV